METSVRIFVKSEYMLRNKNKSGKLLAYSLSHSLTQFLHESVIT